MKGSTAAAILVGVAGAGAIAAYYITTVQAQQQCPGGPNCPPPPPPPQVGLSIKVTQASGSLPVWNVSGVTPNGQFTVVEDGPGFNDIFEYTADASGKNSQPFNVDAIPVGSTVTLTLTDVTTGKQTSTSFKLVAY